MIEQGLSVLIQAATGLYGFPIQLPKDWISAANPQAWTYRSIISTPLYVLNGEDPLTKLEIQIDCHGVDMKNAISLARAVMRSLSGGWHGTMTDDDATVVAGIFRLPSYVDGFSDASRSYVRSLEYEIQYYEA